MQRDDPESKKNSAESKESRMPFFSATKEDDKKSDPILNIPKIPFNVDHYEKVLNIGYFVVNEYEKYIDISRLHAPDNKPGSGFGMAKFREIIKKSMEHNCPGKVSASASTNYGSPHLFYLYMGMSPVSQNTSYVETQYGGVGVAALNKLHQCKDWSIGGLEKSLGLEDFLIKFILSTELKIPFANISTDDLIKNKDFLLTLTSKKLDYVSQIFIPKIISRLSSDPNNKHPNTSSLGPMEMYLTEQGYARWKYVIENNLEFISFKHLEHLNLSLDQQAQLEDILAKRAKSDIRP
jgi:hypothetical protein